MKFIGGCALASSFIYQGSAVHLKVCALRFPD
jgi:hypothetical protein